MGNAASLKGTNDVSAPARGPAGAEA